jgi:hypothetical protein
MQRDFAFLSFRCLWTLLSRIAADAIVVSVGASAAADAPTADTCRRIERRVIHFARIVFWVRVMHGVVGCAVAGFRDTEVRR